MKIHRRQESPRERHVAPLQFPFIFHLADPWQPEEWRTSSLGFWQRRAAPSRYFSPTPRRITQTSPVSFLFDSASRCVRACREQKNKSSLPERFQQLNSLKKESPLVDDRVSFFFFSRILQRIWPTAVVPSEWNWADRAKRHDFSPPTTREKEKEDECVINNESSESIVTEW